MNISYAVLMVITFAIFFQIEAKEAIKVHGAQSVAGPVYRPSPVARQLNDQIPVRLKAYHGSANSPAKVVARYPSLPISSPRFYRPVGSGPAIRRRYQLANGPPGPLPQKRNTPGSYAPTSYNKIRRYPTKSYKYPIYYKSKPGPANSQGSDQRNGYQLGQGGPPLEAKISASNHRYHQVIPHKKNFHASPHFDGKIIVKPNEQKYTTGNGAEVAVGKTQYSSSASAHQYVNFPEQSERLHYYKAGRESEPNYKKQEYYQAKRPYAAQKYMPSPYHGKNPNLSPQHNKYSSYSVYDYSENEEDDDADSYVTESPVKYLVESTDSSTADEAKRYLDFMSSSNYFLPKVSPDYHTKSVAYQQFNVPSSTEPIQTGLNSDLYQSYKSHRINLGPGSSTGIRISSKISTSDGIIGSNSNSGSLATNQNSNNNNNVDSIIVGNHQSNHHHHQFGDSPQQQQHENKYYRPNRRNHPQYNHQQHQQQQQQHQNGPEKIEFTESDAIHSSYTSNPKEILEQSASSSLSSSSSSSSFGGGGGLGSSSSSNIASAVDDIKAKYGLSPKYKVSYQSAKVNQNHQYHHHYPHRITKYQSDTLGNGNSSNNHNNNNNDAVHDDDADDDNHNDDDEVDGEDDANEK